jgi:hypothetical protein
MTEYEATPAQQTIPNQEVKSCDTIGILAVVFAVLAWIPFIGRLFFAAALVLAIISVAQNKKKAIC